MGAYREKYRLHTTNSVISANGSESFGLDTASREAFRKYGGFNACIIQILRATGATISLDGLEDYKVEQPSTFVISADEGRFFNWIIIKDETGAQIDAGDVVVNMSIKERIGNAGN